MVFKVITQWYNVHFIEQREKSQTHQKMRVFFYDNFYVPESRFPPVPTIIEKRCEESPIFYLDSSHPGSDCAGETAAALAAASMVFARHK